jgi:hypothetical protein
VALVARPDLLGSDPHHRGGDLVGVVGAGSTLKAGRHRNPSVAVLQRLAKALGVPLAELLG